MPRPPAGGPLAASPPLPRQRTEHAQDVSPSPHVPRGDQGQGDSALSGTLGRQGRPGPLPAALVVRLAGVAGARDEHGLETADAILRAVVADLGDHAPDGVAVLLNGCDEIIALLPADPNPERTARRLLLHLDHALAQQGLPLVRAFAGLAAHVEPLSTLQLLRRARAGAGRAGRDRAPLHLFETPRDDALLRRHRDADLLRRHIEQGRLLVHYQRLVARVQPQTDTHLEALVRWAVAGQVRPPGQFLALAEDAGLMPALSTLVLEHVLADVAAWSTSGREVSVAVNVPAHVLTGAFLDQLAARMDDAGLERRQISLEVTEAELIDQAARDSLHRCRELDLDVAVDDFGTGYSGLGYLLDVPLTTVKIDRSLVSGVVISPARRSVLRHCISLAHQLGLQVVAEGVETQAEHDEVLALGADWIQGFFVHRPAPVATALLCSGSQATAAAIDPQE